MDFTSLQTRDVAKVKSLFRTIKKRKKQKQPSDQLQAKLDKLLLDSAAKTQQIADNLPKPKLPEQLPISAKGEELVKLLQTHQLIIVAGETGCGKTTQLPKICLQAGFGARGEIAHTQPRRVAATSVARRIAEELNSPLGELVGYSIRFNNKYSSATRIKMMTDGILLAEIESDPLLSKYEVIIIDEAHERSLNIDFLLGFLKKILPKRPDLKVIITSATIDPERFSRHFGDAPMVTVEGRSFPVEVRYRPLDETEGQADSDLLLNGIVAAVDECTAESRGNILIFADGEGQIKSITRRLEKCSFDNTEILPLYARLNAKAQQAIFKDGNKRKIIISTNVAETSLTVPGIIFVIDIGTARISRFSQRSKIQQLPIEKISRASSDQRKGRCGRIAAGTCIRLYSEEDFLNRDEFTLPEIKRTNLSSVVLQLKAMQVADVEDFPFMEPPSERAWKVAFNSLFELAALDISQQITPIGLSMAKLPVDPQLARILIDPELQAVEEMLIFCALMSVREVRERPHDKQQKADNLHQKYVQGDSDVMTAINLWDQLAAKKEELSNAAFKTWCRDNLINFMGLLEWRRVYYQLKEALNEQRHKQKQTNKPKQQPADAEQVHKALIPGFVSHIFYKTQEAYFQGVRGLKVWLHPSSLSFKKSKPWLLSAEMVETEKLYARMNVPLQPQWIEVAVPHLLKSHYQDVHWSKRQGRVTAALNLTLLGLPLVNGRKVDYSKIDADKSRQLFLKEGLAKDQLSLNLPFLQANRHKLKQLEEQEQRQRKAGIRIDEQSLAALYEKVVPQNIVNQSALKKWLKKDLKSNNKQLTFSIKQLTQFHSNQVDDYPASLIVKGFKLNLSYAFAPGTPEDGVSVEIPATMLSQFNDRDFDWLVPGFLEAKILATIKALPKPIRRSLIPLAETAKACYLKLSQLDQENKLFADELAHCLRSLTGVLVKSQDFELTAVEPHLNMKFKIVDQQTKQILNSISDARRSAQTLPKISSIKTSESLQDWPGGAFAIESVEKQGKLTSRIFQGLDAQIVKNSQQVVRVSQFGSQKAAERYHARGISRLLVMRNKSALTRLVNSWPDKKQLEKLNLRAGGFKALADTLAIKTALNLLDDKPTVVEENSFRQLEQLYKQEFHQKMAVALQMILPLLKQREALYMQLSSLSHKAYEDSDKDIREQLQDLWLPENLLAAGDQLQPWYKRFQQGIEARIKRVSGNFPKEAEALEVWVEWQSWWLDFKEAGIKPELQGDAEALFWVLQEYRLSLFSPGVKTSGGVSAKKLQKLFEYFQSQCDE